jgi:hypothetical protein
MAPAARLSSREIAGVRGSAEKLAFAKRNL